MNIHVFASIEFLFHLFHTILHLVTLLKARIDFNLVLDIEFF